MASSLLILFNYKLLTRTVLIYKYLKAKVVACCRPKR